MLSKSESKPEVLELGTLAGPTYISKWFGSRVVTPSFQTPGRAQTGDGAEVGSLDVSGTGCDREGFQAIVPANCQVSAWLCELPYAQCTFQLMLFKVAWVLGSADGLVGRVGTLHNSPHVTFFNPWPTRWGEWG